MARGMPRSRHDFDPDQIAWTRGRARQAKVMVDEFIFFCASLACIAWVITPLWFAGFYLIQMWGDRRYPLYEDSVPKTRNAFNGDDRGRGHEQPQRSVKGEIENP